MVQFLFIWAHDCTAVIWPWFLLCKQEVLMLQNKLEEHSSTASYTEGGYFLVSHTCLRCRLLSSFRGSSDHLSIFMPGVPELRLESSFNFNTVPQLFN